jgi:outer membrane protein assembly factor BamB
MRNASRTTGVLVGCVVLFGTGYAGAQDWPQWRGPHRDNKVTGFTAPKTWPKELTKKWQVTVGSGDSSPVLVGDKVYVFSRQGGDEVTTCLNAATKDVVWQDKFASSPPTPPAAGIHVGPRSTPAVGEGKVCTLGARGVLSCLDAAKGTVLWRKDTKAFPRFFTSSSPLIVDGKCVVYTGALTAYDLAKGEQKWAWPGGGVPYGSPVLMTVAGTKQIVTPTVGALAGIRLDDGKLLWEVKVGSGGKDYQSNFGTPIIDGQTVIYASLPLRAKTGSTVALRIEKQGDGFVANVLWKKDQTAHQYNSPVLRDGLLFGISPSRTFYCMDAKSGDVLWTDTTKRGECGEILAAGPVLLALTSNDTLVAFRPSNKGYEELASYRVADSPTWAAPILAGNRIFVKDQDTLTLWTID